MKGEMMRTSGLRSFGSIQPEPQDISLRLFSVFVTA